MWSQAHGRCLNELGSVFNDAPTEHKLERSHNDGSDPLVFRCRQGSPDILEEIVSPSGVISCNPQGMQGLNPSCPGICNASCLNKGRASPKSRHTGGMDHYACPQKTRHLRRPGIPTTDHPGSTFANAERRIKSRARECGGRVDSRTGAHLIRSCRMYI
jgi:hypothetical protein